MQANQPTHPPSLKIFFATEMWERYGFYVVQTLLALYLVMHFQWNDHRVYPLVGAFTALTYLSPVIGGWIADQLLGQKRSILAGAVVLFFSYLSLGLMQADTGLTISLAGIAVGTGLLKPNISSLLGNEYPIGSPNRERGFTIFYMGITTGIILGTTLPSYLQSLYGWSFSFLSATIGMIIAIAVFSFGIHRYRIADYFPYQHNLKDIFFAVLLIFFMWFGAFYILQQSTLADALFTIIGLFSLIYLLNSLMQESGIQARQTLVIGLLCLISIIFWSFYFQMFLSLTLLLKRVVQPTLWGIPFPPPYYVAVQSLGMIVFGLFLGRHKKQLSLTQHAIRTGNKFLLSIFFMVFAYLLIALVCHFEVGIALISPWFFIPAYLLISLAELLLSPVGLSAITLLSSHKKVSTMMGIFFVSLGLGGFLSGKLAGITAISKEKLDHLSIIGLKAHYAATFARLLYILLAAAVVCIILNRIIKYLMTSQK
ncbi:peptide MFS transporter [Legionella oakridgensis]|uniref:Amino acid/peptide transporter peptide:H+ symporter, bacterial n=2 Tax=Legionella oakridgensis TaxID=29423 RepID=W0BDF5_9GAMM|nr:oligopeptide:H+ symporter [Legionella oakridgensis]AHE66667.1 amino acid/peptide transporter peptide:H+ symporter, bacterial [Legionella oakridgensis ATCC 33761 = DSM 21215]ETO93632.1 amino acid/peptide transporter (peptide:H+ symporter), bacterial [Legionella oakridgensis RV-2-2007]KTD37742.1 POT family transporter protein proton/peptide symporter [Legionella oakridgensis]STY19806.1 proton/peptide symporter, POT family protein [Legionella longbeachae]